MLDTKEEKERERRRKRYKYALVLWEPDIAVAFNPDKDTPDYAVEHKDVLRTWWAQSHTVICDWEPERVLKGMLKLLKEDK